MDKITTSNRLVGTMEEKQEVIDREYVPLKFMTDGFNDSIHTVSIDTYEPLDIFIRKCLIEYFDKYPTISNDPNTLRSCEDVTFPGRHRSLVDIYRICKNYYPSCTLKEVRDILLAQPDLVGHICGEISRRVYRIKTGIAERWSLMGIDEKDEFGLDLREYSKKKNLV